MDLILVSAEGDLIWTDGLWEAGEKHVDWTSDRSVRIIGYLLVKMGDVQAQYERTGGFTLAPGDSLRVRFG